MCNAGVDPRCARISTWPGFVTNLKIATVYLQPSNPDDM